MNSIADPVHFSLVCHPQNSSPAIRGIDVVVGEAASGGLALSFTLKGDISSLRIPESRSSRRMDGLWRHTCFEVFVMGDDAPGYREFNFSPSGEWAAYAFRGYRDGDELSVELPPGILARRTGDRLELNAEICQEFLPSDRSLQLGLSAVVEDTGGVLSYWALRHPPGKPDFHHTDAFAAQLVRP